MHNQLELLFGCGVCGATCTECNRALRSSVEHRHARCDLCTNRRGIAGIPLEPEDPDESRAYLRAWLASHAR